MHESVQSVGAPSLCHRWAFLTVCTVCTVCTDDAFTSCMATLDNTYFGRRVVVSDLSKCFWQYCTNKSFSSKLEHYTQGSCLMFDHPFSRLRRGAKRRCRRRPFHLGRAVAASCWRGAAEREGSGRRRLGRRRQEGFLGETHGLDRFTAFF